MSEFDTVELPDGQVDDQAKLTPRRTPRSARRVMIAVSAAIVIVAALALIAEFALRMIIPSVITSAVREQLNLSSDHPVEVEMQGSALLPALTARVGQTSISVADVQVLDGIEASLYAEVQSMPFDPATGDIIGGTASITVPSSSMNAIVSLVTSGMADSGEISGDEIIVGRTINLFGVQAAVTASIAASVEDGDLLVQPTGVKAAGFDLSAEQLRPFLGDVASTVLDVHTVCVRDRIPAGITLTALDFSRSLTGNATATITASLDPDLLSNPEKQLLGTCGAAG